MSIFGSMQASISGMGAQATRLATVGDNITNATTSGYKRAEAVFSSMVLPSNGGNYSAGGVVSHVRYSIADQGPLTYTTSTTDLSIQGAGFFVVKDAADVAHLTRAGGFVATADGFLTNAAGYRLTGVPFVDGAAPVIPPGGYSTIQAINLKGGGVDLIATPSTAGRLNGNVNADATTVPSVKTNPLASENLANSVYSHHTRQTDPSGVSDIYYTKVGDNTWEVSVYYDKSGAGGSFPYDLSDPDMFYVSTRLTFDATTGAITGGDTILYPDPADTFAINLSGIRHNGADTAVAGKFGASINLPSDVPAILAGQTAASANLATSTYTSRSQTSGFTGVNGGVPVDVYYTKIDATTWEVSFFETSKATGGGFPYGAAGDPPLGTMTLEFDPVTGALVNGGQASIPMPGGANWDVDFTGTVSKPMATIGLPESVNITLNLAKEAAVVRPVYSGNTPAQNGANAQHSHKTSMIAYDNLGRSVMLDIYYTKVADNTWEVAAFNNADASAGGFPYTSGPLSTTTMEFSPLNGKILNAPIMDIPITGGQTVKLDLFGTTQLADVFVVNQGIVNGSAVAKVQDYQVDSKGVLSAVYTNGDIRELYQLALASVESPNNLSVISGTVYQQSAGSGAITLGNPATIGLGTVKSGTLETSNVDIADELSQLIESQKMYTANSKVFQTSADLLETIANLKR